jgi:peptide/nickel transport system substrate-binding protein
LFDVSLGAVKRPDYVNGTRNDRFPLYQQGWFPDFLDADNYVAPFYGSETSYLNTHYVNEKIDKLIRRERAARDQSVRLDAFRTIQRLGAEDAVFLPLWQSRQIAVARDEVKGLADTLDAAYRMRYWMISQSR